jgi:broad specificity phosphatase PhoE
MTFRVPARWVVPAESPAAMLLEGQLQVNWAAKKRPGIYLVEHAATAEATNDPKTDRITGQSNISISAQGRREAAALGQALKGRGIIRVFCSDLKRACQTAEIIARVLGVPNKELSGLRPWDLGDMVGKLSADVHPQIKKYSGSQHAVPVPGGESFDTFKNRVLASFQGLVHAYRDIIAVVIHSRDLELIQGWLEAGAKPDLSIDTSRIDKDDLKTSEIYFVDLSGGKIPHKLEELVDNLGHPGGMAS